MKRRPGIFLFLFPYSNASFLGSSLLPGPKLRIRLSLLALPKLPILNNRSSMLVSVFMTSRKRIHTAAIWMMPRNTRCRTAIPVADSSSFKTISLTSLSIDETDIPRGCCCPLLINDIAFSSRSWRSLGSEQTCHLYELIHCPGERHQCH